MGHRTGRAWGVSDGIGRHGDDRTPRRRRRWGDRLARLLRGGQQCDGAGRRRRACDRCRCARAGPRDRARTARRARYRRRASRDGGRSAALDARLLAGGAAAAMAPAKGTRAGRRARSMTAVPPLATARLQLRALTVDDAEAMRSEEHTSELQSLTRISYAVFCLKKKNRIAMHT